jgi:hypothetical protein
VTDEQEDDGEVVFELAEWGDEFRAALTKVLDERKVPHDWEGTDLVVDDVDADLVDAILDELEATPLDEIVPVDDTPPAENEAGYDDVSSLFVAADRLLHAPDDPEIVNDFADAAAAVEATAPPYGVGEPEWTRVQAAAVAVVQAIEAEDAEVDAAPIGVAARALRDLLRPYV